MNQQQDKTCLFIYKNLLYSFDAVSICSFLINVINFLLLVEGKRLNFVTLSLNLNLNQQNLQIICKVFEAFSCVLSVLF